MRKYFRKVCGVCAFVSFFLMFGFVGAVEQDMVPLGIGTFRMFAALGAWALFTWLAGGFEPYVFEKKEDRPRR